MPTITIIMTRQVGETGLTLFLRRESSGALLNAGGDALTESPADSGYFIATVAEVIDEICSAVVTDAIGPVDGGGWLPKGGTLITDTYPYAVGALTVEQAAQLDAIEAKTAQITGARLQVVGPVTPGGDILLIVNKDYVDAAENGLTRTISDVGGLLHARLTDVDLAAELRFGAGRQSGIGQIVGTIAEVAYAADVTSITIEIDRAEIPDSLLAADDYEYQIERETSAGDKVVEVSGNLTLVRRRV